VSRGLYLWVGALLAVITAAVAGWRVLGPAEVLFPSTAPYPALVDRAPGVTGRTNAAPLIVDGRVRVYAAKRSIRADSPVDSETLSTPDWSFRRWPQQVSGVVAVGRTVISRWSDGELVALDGGTGKIAWRVDGPPAPGYSGWRTGARTVWRPTDLHLFRDAVVVVGGGRLVTYDAGTGARRLEISLPSGCAKGFTTASGFYACPTGVFNLTTGQPVPGFPKAPSQPLGCQIATSACVGLRDAAGQGWFVDKPVARRVADLDRPGSNTAAGLVFYPEDGMLRVAEPDGKLLRTYGDRVRLLGADGSRVLLLSPRRQVRDVDPRTDAEFGDFEMRLINEPLNFDAGLVQVTGGHLVIERLSHRRKAGPEKDGYYFSMNPVIIAKT
jgi:putative pyrroloquinoline-quinone binding quinoprotein